jgi:tripartite ATP-independent transporter DctP family solute receptor
VSRARKQSRGLRSTLCLLAIAALTAVACGGGSSGTTTVTMKVGHDSGLDFPYQVAALWFKDQVEAKTNGRVKVQIYPNAQLGDEATMTNGLKVGSVDAIYTSTAPLSTSTPEIDLFSLPFLFKDVDHAMRVTNGPIGDQVKAKVQSAIGAQLVGWGSVGERDMWNSKHPIRTIADLKGLKMRTQQSQIQVDTYSALGAQATPMSFSDLFTALQTHVVDGADNGPLDIEGSKFYQVTKYVSLTSHFILIAPMVISDKFLAKLSAEDRQTVLDLGKQSVPMVTAEAKKQNVAAIAQLKTQGLEFFDISAADHQAFVTAVQSVYAKNAARVGGATLIQQVLQTP